jgi:two-component system nitrate/nitrite response regulator NarL
VITRVYIIGSNPLAENYLRLLLTRIPSVSLQNKTIIDTATFRIYIVDGESLLPSLKMNIQHLRRTAPTCRILLIGRTAPFEKIADFRGIDGFIAYDRVGREIKAAIKALQRGNMWWSKDLLEHIAHRAMQLDSGSQRDAFHLTLREASVANLVQQRFSNKEIASELNISERTVKFHVTNIFRKFGINDRRALARLAESGALRMRKSSSAVMPSLERTGA